MKNIHYIILGTALFALILFGSIRYLDKDTDSGWQTLQVSESVGDMTADKKLTWNDETESLKVESIDEGEKPINLVMNEERAASNAKAKLLGTDNSPAVISNSLNAKTIPGQSPNASSNSNDSAPYIDFSATGNSVNFKQVKNAESSRLTLVGEGDQRYSADLSSTGGIKNFSGLKDGHYRWEVFSSKPGTKERAQQTSGSPVSGGNNSNADITVERGRFEIRNGQIVEDVFPEEDLEEMKKRDGDG